MTTTVDERPIVRPDLIAVLEDGGYRITRPRRSVIAVLDQKDEGFTAEELCSEVPGVGRATVYRTIKLLQRQALSASWQCRTARRGTAWLAWTTITIRFA